MVKIVKTIAVDLNATTKSFICFCSYRWKYRERNDSDDRQTDRWLVDFTDANGWLLLNNSIHSPRRLRRKPPLKRLKRRETNVRLSFGRAVNRTTNNNGTRIRKRPLDPRVFANTLLANCVHEVPFYYKFFFISYHILCSVFHASVKVHNTLSRSDKSNMLCIGNLMTLSAENNTVITFVCNVSDEQYIFYCITKTKKGLSNIRFSPLPFIYNIYMDIKVSFVICYWL